MAQFAAMNVTIDSRQLLSQVAEDVGFLFYVVSPNKTTFEKAEDVPDYLNRVSGISDELRGILFN